MASFTNALSGSQLGQLSPQLGSSLSNIGMGSPLNALSNVATNTPLSPGQLSYIASAPGYRDILSNSQLSIPSSLASTIRGNSLNLPPMGGLSQGALSQGLTIANPTVGQSPASLVLAAQSPASQQLLSQSPLVSQAALEQSSQAVLAAQGFSQPLSPMGLSLGTPMLTSLPMNNQANVDVGYTPTPITTQDIEITTQPIEGQSLTGRPLTGRSSSRLTPRGSRQLSMSDASMNNSPGTIQALRGNSPSRSPMRSPRRTPEVTVTSNPEEVLTNMGYQIQDKIYTQTTSGQSEAKYILATNPNGYPLFVELDEPGYIAVSPGDGTLVEAKDSIVQSNISSSLKRGALARSADSNGVALFCEGELCFVNKDVQSELTEKTFIYSEKINEQRSGSYGDSVLAYPVMKLSLIVSNNEAASIVTRNVGKDLAMSALIQSMRDQEQFKREANELCMSIQQYLTLREMVGAELYSSITRLEDYNDSYMRMNGMNDDNAAKFMRVKDNLRMRYRKLVEYLRVNQNLNREVMGIRAINADMNSLMEYLRSNFKEIGSAM